MLCIAVAVAIGELFLWAPALVWTFAAGMNLGYWVVGE
jgi:hypothetical protein